MKPFITIALILLSAAMTAQTVFPLDSTQAPTVQVDGDTITALCGDFTFTLAPASFRVPAGVSVPIRAGHFTVTTPFASSIQRVCVTLISPGVFMISHRKTPTDARAVLDTTSGIVTLFNSCGEQIHRPGKEPIATR